MEILGKWLSKNDYFCKNRDKIEYNEFPLRIIVGELAQLARAPALHAGGQGFDSLILHKMVIF
jgi:hypothetical protein